MLKILSHFEYPPIPVRNFDWVAVLDNYDGAPDAGHQPTGYGCTREDAIDDLIEQVRDQ